MQEQLPLRPAEFVKIRDGFIAFLKQPAGTPIGHVIPQGVIDAMTLAAKRGRKRRHLLGAVKGISAIVAVTGAILGLAIEPMIVGTAIMLAGGMTFVWALNRGRVRDEPEFDELTHEPDEQFERARCFQRSDRERRHSLRGAFERLPRRGLCPSK
jgi:hypothetical protein